MDHHIALSAIGAFDHVSGQIIPKKKKKRFWGGGGKDVVDVQDKNPYLAMHWCCACCKYPTHMYLFLHPNCGQYKFKKGSFLEFYLAKCKYIGS